MFSDPRSTDSNYSATVATRLSECKRQSLLRSLDGSLAQRCNSVMSLGDLLPAVLAITLAQGTSGGRDEHARH